eukprot:953980_1
MSVEKLTCQVWSGPQGGWSNSAPECQASENYCPPAFAPTNGSILASNRSLGGVASFNCSDGYHLTRNGTNLNVSVEQITCQVWSGSQGGWSNTGPDCQAPLCIVPDRMYVVNYGTNYSVGSGYTVGGSNLNVTCDSNRHFNSTKTQFRIANCTLGGLIDDVCVEKCSNFTDTCKDQMSTCWNDSSSVAHTNCFAALSTAMSSSSGECDTVFGCWNASGLSATSVGYAYFERVFGCHLCCETHDSYNSCKIEENTSEEEQMKADIKEDGGVTAAEYMVDSLWGHLPCLKKTKTTQRSRRQTDRPPPRKRRKVPNCRRAKPSLVPQEDDPLIAMEKATAVARSERSKKQKLQSDKSPVPA